MRYQVEGILHIRIRRFSYGRTSVNQFASGNRYRLPIKRLYGVVAALCQCAGGIVEEVIHIHDGGPQQKQED
ncbi:MAG: hypothetical protein P8J37_04735 [Fuerstiella sp.]|nr:hypothetical protein [Fuerstiella sp.]